MSLNPSTSNYWWYRSAFTLLFSHHKVKKVEFLWNKVYSVCSQDSLEWLQKSPAIRWGWVHDVALPFGFPSVLKFWSTFSFWQKNLPLLHSLHQTGLTPLKAIMRHAEAPSPSLPPSPAWIGHRSSFSLAIPFFVFFGEKKKKAFICYFK